jgi:hypothetical protein
MKKENVILGLFNHKKKLEILPFATPQMELEIMLSEISQAQKNKYHMISLLCGIFFKS